jgi:hypothetical protein
MRREWPLSHRLYLLATTAAGYLVLVDLLEPCRGAPDYCESAPVFDGLPIVAAAIWLLMSLTMLRPLRAHGRLLAAKADPVWPQPRPHHALVVLALAATLLAIDRLAARAGEVRGERALAELERLVAERRPRAVFHLVGSVDLTKVRVERDAWLFLDRERLVARMPLPQPLRSECIPPGDYVPYFGIRFTRDGRLAVKPQRVPGCEPMAPS